MKLAGSNPEPAPQPEPPMGGGGIDAAPIDDMGGETPSNEKPFDDEPFDAGVDVDEESDPKNFIEKLTGKLGQSLRKYNDSQGQPDFELEKFAINSLLSATHTSEMDSEDQKDIINKIKSAGDIDSTSDNDDDDESIDEPIDEPSEEELEEPSEEELEEYRVFEQTEVEKNNPDLYPKGWKEMDGMFLKDPKKNNMFQPGSNDELNESCWKGYEQIGMKDKNGRQVPNCVPIKEGKNLGISTKKSIFGKAYLKAKLNETFNQEDDMNQPEIETEPAPVITPTKPSEKPMVQPSRRDKPFLPIPNVQPDPKAVK